MSNKYILMYQRDTNQKDGCEILDAVFSDSYTDVTIDPVAKTVSAKIKAGVSLVSIISFFVLSEGARIFYDALPYIPFVNGSILNCSVPIELLVVAENNVTRKLWTILLTNHVASSEANILSWKPENMIGDETINQSENTIDVLINSELPFDALNTIFALSQGAVCRDLETGNLISGATLLDYAEGIRRIEVLAEDGIHGKDYRLNIKHAPPLRTGNHVISWHIAEGMIGDESIFFNDVEPKANESGHIYIHGIADLVTDLAKLKSIFTVSEGAIVLCNNITEDNINRGNGMSQFLVEQMFSNITPENYHLLHQFQNIYRDFSGDLQTGDVYSGGLVRFNIIVVPETIAGRVISLLNAWKAVDYANNTPEFLAILSQTEYNSKKLFDFENNGSRYYEIRVYWDSNKSHDTRILNANFGGQNETPVITNAVVEGDYEKISFKLNTGVNIKNVPVNITMSPGAKLYREPKNLNCISIDSKYEFVNGSAVDFTVYSEYEKNFDWFIVAEDRITWNKVVFELLP